MRICIYCESLRTLTSGTPMRAMIRELIAARPQDKFLMVVRKGFKQDPVLVSFFDTLKPFGNWELVEDRMSRRISNVLGLLRYKHYCKVGTKADVYLNPDCNSLGRHAHPLIVTITDLSSFRSIEYTSYKKNWQLWLRRFMMSNAIAEADQVVAISKSTANEIIKLFPKAASRVTVIYNGIQPDWISAQTDGAPQGDYWIWWGMISGRKNLNNLLRAYAQLKEEMSGLPKIRIVYGNQELPETIQSMITELGIEKEIETERSKPLKELIRIVGNSKGLVFPSHIEGFGMPVIESFARGIPVLTSSTTSLSEVAGGLAILVDPSSIDSIKIGLKELHYTTRSEKDILQRKEWASKFTPSYASTEFSRLIENFAAGKTEGLN